MADTVVPSRRTFDLRAPRSRASTRTLTIALGAMYYIVIHPYDIDKRRGTGPGGFKRSQQHQTVKGGSPATHEMRAALHAVASASAHHARSSSISFAQLHISCTS